MSLKIHWYRTFFLTWIVWTVAGLFETQPLQAENLVRSGFLYMDDPSRAYHLVGKWMSWKDSGEGRYPNILSDTWQPIQVPGLWNNLGINHRGSIYYRLDFKLGRELQNTDLGLIVPNTALAYEVYINGKQISSIGEIAATGEIIRKSTESSFNILPKTYIVPKGTNTLLIRVASYGGVGGFNLGNIFLGAKDIVQEKYLRSLLWDTMNVAIFIFVGLYHLIIYSVRTKDKDYLFYSLLCFDLALYHLSFTTLSYIIWNNFYFYYFGTVFSVNLFPILIIQFFHKFFEQKKNFFAKSINVASLFLMVIALFLNTSGEENFQRYNSFVLKWLLAVVGISIAYPMYLIWTGIQIEKVGRYLILIGYLIFVLAVINDILIYLNLYNFTKFVEIGFLVFILSISFAMALKFAQVHIDLEYLTENLKQEVSKRTSELTETNQKLIEMDRIKTAFFANVTHELRTPITLSLLPIEQLMKKTKDPSDLELLQTAHRNNIKLLKLINDLLDFAKLETGALNLRLMPVNISKIVEELIHPFEINAKERGIQIAIEIEANCICPADPEKLEKIITNLLSNAYKFTENQGKIWLKVSKIRKNTEFIQILVGNSGIGIPESELKHIFERFYQADMSIQRKFEGTGIGLSLVKEFTELHGGYVEVLSIPGEKTEFSVYLPTGDYKSLDTSLDSPKENSREITNPSELSMQWIETISENISFIQSYGHRKELPNILIVEDNKEMAYLLNDLLKESYNITIVTNPLKAIEMVTDIQPDLILSDVMMPELNGFQLINALRKNKNIQDVPIILLTAMNDLDNKLEGFSQGVDDYISKPFMPEELKARIASLIEKSRLQREKNRRLYQLQKELILARDIQTLLLPQEIPTMNNLSIHSLYIPLDEVGGDFYDIHIENGIVTIFMADVSGHGVPACLIASMVKMAFQSEIRQKKNITITDIMRGINKSLYKIIANNFVTACIGRIFPETREFRYITAGHPPIYHISRGKATPRHTKGKPIGMFENSGYEYESFLLEPNDSLFFYTDGIIECRSPQNELYEEKRLISFLERHSNLEPEEVIESLTQELRGYTGGIFLEDDITALHVKIYS